jgi:uncharacterized protein (TIGR00369 family)
MTEVPSADRLKLDVEQLNDFLHGAFPQAERGSFGLVTVVRPGFLRMVLDTARRQTRPGGWIPGPVMMALVDVAGYALTAAHIGPQEMALTSSLNMQFLRGCDPGTLTADASLLRLGRRLVISEVRLWTESEARPVAQAVVTYALP